MVAALLQSTASDTIWRDLVGVFGVPGAALCVFVGILLWRTKWNKPAEPAPAPVHSGGNGTAVAIAKAKEEALEYAQLLRLAEDTATTVDQMFQHTGHLEGMAGLVADVVALQREESASRARVVALLESQQKSLELYGALLDYLATRLRQDIKSDVRDVLIAALNPPRRR